MHTRRVTPAQTTPLITFHKPCYANMIKLFSHGHRPWKALSHQMDWTYLDAPKEAQDGLSTSFPDLSEVDKEISALGWALIKGSPTGMTLPDNNHQSIMMPILALWSTVSLMEEWTFLPSDVPWHLIPSSSTMTADCQGEPFLREIL